MTACTGSRRLASGIKAVAVLDSSTSLLAMLLTILCLVTAVSGCIPRELAYVALQAGSYNDEDVAFEQALATPPSRQGQSADAMPEPLGGSAEAEESEEEEEEYVKPIEKLDSGKRCHFHPPTWEAKRRGFSGLNRVEAFAV